MTRNKQGSLLVIVFARESMQQATEELRLLFDNVDEIHSMDDLENATTDYSAVLYLMDITSADHLYNIHYIRNKYSNKQFFVIASTVSIPLLHQALHIGVNDLFISPLSSQDKDALLSCLKKRACPECFSDEIIDKRVLSCYQIDRAHPISILLDIVEHDYVRGPSLQDLADKIHLSPSRICHLFKELCGMTYSYYLLCRKIEEGERLLTMGQHSITSISYQIGFANPSHFCRSFKEHFNITPTSYINGNREVEHSSTYLTYQRLRYELFSSVASEAKENRVSLAKKWHVS